MGYLNRVSFFLLVLQLITGQKGMAQETKVVLENFSSNERYWYVGNMDHASVVMQNNTYTIDRLSNTGENVFTIDNYIDPQKDFSIACTLQIEQAGPQAYAGLVWNYADMDNFDAFCISGDGTFKAIAARYGNLFDLTDSLVSSHAIKKNGKKNTLKVVRKGEEYLYFINDEKVLTSPFPGLKYTAHGFYTWRKIKFQVTSFALLQQQEINQVKNFKEKKQSLGAVINSSINDSAPLISPDGSTLFFSREVQGAHNADIWQSKKAQDGSWSKALNVGAPLNNKVFNSVVSCSPDNKSVLLLNTYFPDGSYKGCCFSSSYFDGAQWSAPQDILIDNLNAYGKWLDASLSADNHTMVLSVQRPGSMGYNDLYVSFKQGIGHWSEPLNLGASINTIFNEAAPFLAADNRTLYFSSLGYPGYGNQDIFMSKRLDESWTNWSPPINLGSSVNSTGFDAFFSIAVNESFAYLVSSAGSMGGTDVFKLDLPQALLPERVCLLSGKVVDNKTNKPLQAQLTCRSLSHDQSMGVAVSDNQDGSYRLVLPQAGAYYISASKKGYYAQADSISFSDQGNQSLQKELILRLDPLVVGKSLSIRQLYFEKTKAALLPVSIPALDNLYDLLRQNPQLKIKIEGHTDNVGDAALNEQLSLERAKAVYQYLVQKGIDKARMETIGYGGTRPIADNNKEETRRLNRRVEFTVIEY